MVVYKNVIRLQLISSIHEYIHILQQTTKAEEINSWDSALQYKPIEIVWPKNASKDDLSPHSTHHPKQDKGQEFLFLLGILHILCKISHMHPFNTCKFHSVHIFFWMQ